MFRPARNIGVAGTLLSIGLMGSTGLVAAQTAGHRGHAAPLKGVVTAVNANTLQLQTQSGVKSVGLTSATRIVRVMSGTTSDLSQNARVDLHLVQGTTTVSAVQIDAVAHNKVHAKTPSGTHTGTHTKTWTGTPRGSTSTTRAARGAHAHADGLISSVSGNSVTIRDGKGQSKTYSLANNVTITKVMSGAASDLSVGQTVQAFVNSSNAAIAITILTA